MGDEQLRTVERARDGRVTCANHVRLGYSRLTRGVYGQAIDRDGLPDRAVRRVTWWAFVQGVMAAYRGQRIALCTPSALQALGVALPARLENWDTCHLMVTGTCHPQRRCVITHRVVGPLPVWRRVGGVPVIHPVDAWVQLRGATDDELVEVGDGLLRRKTPLLSVEALERRLDALAGTPGVKAARRVIRWLAPGTDSPAETRTRLVLVRGGLPCPSVNPAVYCALSGWTYHLDMAYEAQRVGVEYDGTGHVGDARQMEIDAQRRRELQDEGWLIINVTASQLREPASLIASVERALVLREGRFPVPPS